MDNLTNETIDRLLDAIDRLLAEKNRILVAIDGPCAAGKTTLAAILEKHYGCNVLHMDEFFLRPQQRTPERLAQPGGNVDYERFYEEVLLPLSSGTAFTYRPFSCRTQSLSDDKALSPTALTVVEGTYSTHPYFQDPYDLKIFLSIDPKIQAQRIGQRPQWKQERFFREWIPMEQLYFDHFQVARRCHILL